MEILIRPATLNDKQAVEKLLQDAELAALDDSSQFGPQYAVACDANRSIIGVAGVEVYESVGLLRSVVVADGQRGQGIGKTLASNRVAWATSHGMEELYLLTNDAVEHWQSRGFRVIDRSHAPASITKTSEWTGACPASATAMSLRL